MIPVYQPADAVVQCAELCEEAMDQERQFVDLQMFRSAAVSADEAEFWSARAFRIVQGGDL